MTTETIEAVYEHGGFRPVTPESITLEEGQKVRIVVEPLEKQDNVLSLATQVYEGLSEDEIDAIEQHIQRRENFFDKRIAP